MVDTNNVSWKLMKSPKELASWNFPLSDILDSYFNSLPEACKIQYGEAAVVIQNSTNAYVRRVEDLYDETRSLNYKIINNESTGGNIITSITRMKKKKKKSDFDNFRIHEFDKEIGKNINLKLYEEKTMKFLHHCFSQLENAHVNLAIELVDTVGETIGKKYDFRCSQGLTNNGSLVDEFAPTDFIIIEKSKGAFLSTPFIPNKDVMRIMSLNNHYNMSTVSNNIIYKYHSNSDTLQFQAINSDTTISIHDSRLLMFHSNELSNIESHLPTFEFVNNISVVSNDTENVFHEYTSHRNDTINEEEIEFESGNSSYPSKAYIQCHEENSATCNYKRASCIVKINDLDERKSSFILEYNVNKNKSNIEISGEKTEFNSGLRRSQRLCVMINPNSESGIHNDHHVLKPIPFQNGIPDKINKSRKEFQLPCHIDLLKQIVGKPKRRTKIKNRVRQRPAVSSAHRSNPISDKFRIMKCSNTSEDSLLKLELAAMKEEVSNKLRRSYDDMLSNNQEPVNFTSVMKSPTDPMNISQCDLRKPTNLNSFETLSNTAHFISPAHTPLAFSSFKNVTSLLSPSTSNFDCLISKYKDRISSTNWKYKNKFGNYIKYKMKEIYEELDLHTEEDQKVAKWHAEIKPRLIAAEQKPPFRIFEYESRILRRLETSDRKGQFDDIFRQEPPSEVARYFSATLQLVRIS
ncbi:uncharacterized protein LOC100115493 [Nasonia vitripennis]|uniref:Condensin-2 complex subunit H2 C-terminal domain-containing protein n=1 Tax=Nasonia vitripennis TaxID=7425 RepID=A0A7M7R402_NASVI|nr:uncharacterized protein LOC100115493 [Nasonia vitripennis]